MFAVPSASSLAHAIKLLTVPSLLATATTAKGSTSTSSSGDLETKAEGRQRTEDVHSRCVKSIPA